MKKFNIILTSALLITILFSSCEDRRFQTFTANVPIYMSYEDLRKAVVVEDAVPMVEPGKIYFYDKYIFINEYMKGIHIIDIEDPSSPSAISFITIPGNVDMAIKDNILYADSYIDLVLIDISDPLAPIETNRLDSILSYTLPLYDTDYPLAQIDYKEGVVTDWEVKEHKQEIYYNHYPWPIFAEYDMLSSSRSFSSGSAAAGPSYGVGGSMARYATYDDYLYLLQDQNNLKVVDISNIESPVISFDKYVGWGLETMFMYDDHMYLGATNGMHIFDLKFPDNPIKTSEYSHVTSCDPVVVDGNTAYVTLRSGNICGGTADLLDVIDVSDKYDPERIASFTMNEPYGLGISNNTLFICQGDNGLVVYDATNPLTIDSHKIAEFTDIKATDVIPLDTVLFTIGEGGFYIYDYSDVENITLISSLAIAGE
jgi:hypothetical protein